MVKARSAYEEEKMEAKKVLHEKKRDLAAGKVEAAIKRKAKELAYGVAKKARLSHRKKMLRNAKKKI